MFIRWIIGVYILLERLPMDLSDQITIKWGGGWMIEVWFMWWGIYLTHRPQFTSIFSPPVHQNSGWVEVDIANNGDVIDVYAQHPLNPRFMSN